MPKGSSKERFAEKGPKSVVMIRAIAEAAKNSKSATGRSRFLP